MLSFLFQLLSKVNSNYPPSFIFLDPKGSYKGREREGMNAGMPGGGYSPVQWLNERSKGSEDMVIRALSPYPDGEKKDIEWGGP